MRRIPAILIVVGSLAVTPAFADPLVLQGSTTLSSRLMVPHQHAIEEVSSQKLIIVPNKSSTGLQALFENGAQFAMISGPLDIEIKALRKLSPNAPFERLQTFELARTRMAFAVHPDNPVRAITTANLRRILLGEVRNWRDVGGRDVPIRLVVVREGGGVQASVESQVLEGRKISAPDPIRVQISSQVVKIVLQEPGALGLAQWGVISRAHAPEIKVDEPVEQRLSLVTLGNPTPAMLSVIKATRQIASQELE
jgi:ABC-type phosphate transport system substrate-binding protein